MTGEQAVEAIHTYIRKDAVPGLSRIRELLARLGNPQRRLKFVHIAGTNGKGSTAAMTASVLTCAGYRTGLFTSPFLFRFEERIQIDGCCITGSDLAAATASVLPQAEAMAEKPTEFELVCAVAFTYFANQKCDIVVLEAGMGGLNDATNGIDTPEVAVITNIGLDHTEFLGNTAEKIAQAKAGIFKKNGRAVIYRGSSSVEAVFERVCQERNLSLRKADFDGIRLLSQGLDGQVFDCGRRKHLELPLLGIHQLRNAAVVLEIIDSLIDAGWNITEDHIRKGLRTVRWPGRFDVISRDPLFIVDGGHNEQCVEALVSNIRSYLRGKKLVALTGVLADKDYADMYRPIMPYVDQFVCITPPSPRRLEAAELAACLKNAGARASAWDSIPEGVKAAKALASPDGAVLCLGSLYSIADIEAAAAAGG